MIHNDIIYWLGWIAYIPQRLLVDLYVYLIMMVMVSFNLDKILATRFLTL